MKVTCVTKILLVVGLVLLVCNLQAEARYLPTRGGKMDRLDKLRELLKEVSRVFKVLVILFIIFSYF